ncbi:hypothetical protein EDD22DRAFT_959421 [Suillus occidentalis]|nr:hypothetical protein EDD22DRAFT_959421 [Suillus occidentalis]
MPPKKTKGGGGKKGKEDGGSVLHMNDRPIEASIPKVDIAKETHKLDNQVAKCKVGIAWVDLLKIGNRLKFGVYNDRPENETETKRLVGCFERYGILSMKEVSAIPLILKTSRLKDATKLTKSFDEPEDIVELELKDLDEIVVASGQHRLAALRLYNQTLQDEYKVQGKKREKIRALKNTSQEHIASYNECHDEMCRLKGLLHGNTKWGVVIYDEDKLLEKGTTLAHHLSRNSGLHEYKETEEEVLITVLKKVKGVYDNSPHDKRNALAIEHLLEVRTQQEKNARLHKVLHHENMCMFLGTRLLCLGPHFRHRREFMVNWLAKNMDVCMGTRSDVYKALSSKAPFPSSDEMTGLLQKVFAGDEAAIKRVGELRTSLGAHVKAKDEHDLSIWASVMDSINKHASFAFSDIKDHIGDMTPTYVEPLSSYRQKVVQSLKDAWGLTENEDFKENEILVHLDRVVARVMLHLTPEQGKTNAPEPLLCGMLMDHAWTTFGCIKEGLQEISRWFETLLDYYKMLHPKRHTMDDWTTVMLQNISKDQRFISNGSEYSAKVTNLIWEHRRTFMVRLTNYMIVNQTRLTPRAKDKKALVSAFDALPEEDIIASETLTKLLQNRRMKANKSRDFSSEPGTVAGVMSLHTTAWDWLSPTLKNTARDIDPCMRAITVERFYVRTYRPRMLEDKYIGALRRLLEEMLTLGVKEVTTIDSHGLLSNKRAWLWWDGLVLSPTQEAPAVLLEGIKDDIIKEQRQQQDSLVMETADREAIQKLVTYISNMPCAISSCPTTMLSADVINPLQDLITGLEVNAARNRTRKLNKKSTMVVDLNKVNFDLGIQIPDGYVDTSTIGYSDETTTETGEQSAPKKGTKKGKGRDVEEKDTTAPVPVNQQPAKKDTAKQAKSRAVEQEGTPDPTQKASLPHSRSTVVEREATPAITPDARDASQPVKPKPKPRPIPVKKAHRQQSPPAIDDDIEILDEEPQAAESSPDATNATPIASPAPDEDAAEPPTSPAPSTDQHTDCEGTVPSSQEHPDAEASTDDGHDSSDATPHRSSSPFIGFSLTDTQWYDPDSDKDCDHDMEDGVGIVEEEEEDIMTPIDDHQGKDLVPTQPLTQVPQSPKINEHRVAATHAPAPPPVKRQRAPTTNSTASSTSGRGRTTKKKAKVAQADDAEFTFIPGV